MDANPFEQKRDRYLDAMREVRTSLRQALAQVKPFDKQALSPEEETLAWDNPALLLPGATDEATGLPLTNDQALVQWYQKLTDGGRYPSRYIRWADDVWDRAERRTKEAMQRVQPE